MSKVIDRWAEMGKDEGHYAVFSGFEQDIRQYNEELAEAYDEMEIYDRIMLFAFITDLIDVDTPLPGKDH
jgi:hypothetical protein